MTDKSETQLGQLASKVSVKNETAEAMQESTAKNYHEVKNLSKGDEIVKMLFTGLSADKEIKLLKPSDEDIINYSKEIPLREDENFSLNFFLQEKYDRDRVSQESKKQVTPKEISSKLDREEHGDDEAVKSSKNQRKKIDYIKQINDSDKIIIADLRNIQISANNEHEMLNLQGANFRGAYFNGARFVRCNLKDATFADTDLKKVSIKYSDITHTDFRGCNLQTCVFGKEYANEPYNKMKGVMFSMSSSELRIFGDIKTAIAQKNEEHRRLGHKKLLLSEISQKTKLLTKILYFLGFEIEAGPYKTIKKEIADMEKGVFHKNYIVQETIKYLFENEACRYYPIYKNFIQDIYDIRIKIYIKLSKQQVEEFLNQAKNHESSTSNENIPEQDEGANIFSLSLNDFAEAKYIESLEEKSNKGEKANKDVKDVNDVAQDASNAAPDIDIAGQEDAQTQEVKVTYDDKEIIADLSSKVNKFGNNEWQRLDLKSMVFENLDMSYVNFIGSDLSECKFNNVNLQGCNFNCCLLEEAKFVNCDLSDASMITSDLSGASFEGVSFLRSNLNWVNAKSAKFKNCDLSYISSEFGNWAKADFDTVKIDGSSLTKSKLPKARFVNSVISNCILNFADLSSLQASSTSISASLANNITLKEAVFDKKCSFDKLESTKSDWTGVKIHEFSKFTNCNFENSILDGLKAASTIFTACNLDETKIGHGKFSDCDFQGSHFRFAEFNNSLFSQCRALGSDFSGVSIFNTKMSDSVFSAAHFNGAKIIDSNLNNSKFDNAVWFNVHIKSSMMEKVDNHRIKINDVTEFIDCSISLLEGQFYYYDEEGFMEVMFIEQQRAHQNRIQKLLTTSKWKILVPFLKIFSKEYNISVHERNKIILARKRNRNDLRIHYKNIKEEPSNIGSGPILKVKNLIRSHNL